MYLPLNGDELSCDRLLVLAISLFHPWRTFTLSLNSSEQTYTVCLPPVPSKNNSFNTFSTKSWYLPSPKKKNDSTRVWPLAWPEIRPLSRRRPPRLKTLQHPRERKLWPKNLRFRLSPHSRPPNDRLRLHTLLPSPRNHAHMAKVRYRGGYLECRLYFCRDVGGETPLSGEGSR